MNITLQTIHEDDYEQFIERHPLGNFVQSVPNAYRNRDSGWHAHFVGARNKEGKLIATALLYEWKTMGWGEFECLQGPLLDYGDTVLMMDFLVALRHYVKEHRGFLLRVQPPLILRRGDDAAKLIDDTSHLSVVTEIGKAGFKSIPVSQTDNNARYLRWMFAKDLSDFANDAELVASFDTKTRSSIRFAHKQGIRVKEITDKTELSPLVDLMLETGKRRHFSARNAQYYEELFSYYSRKQARFVIATLDVDVYRQKIEEQSRHIEEQYTAIGDDPARMGERKELDNQRNAIKKRRETYNELKELNLQGVIPLAAAIFMTVGPEFVYFLSGSDDRYASFNAPYAIQEWALKTALSEGFHRYNFYGTNGNFNDVPAQEGVYRFKKGFGGQLEEWSGCFDYVARPAIFVAVSVIRWVRSIIH